MKAVFTGIALLYFFTVNAQKNTFAVYFDFNRRDLTAEAQSRLDSFIQVNREGLASITIRLDGYCDFRGTDDYNKTLSEKRVATVRKYLLTHGMRQNNLVSLNGHGEKNPGNENRTEEEMQFNRRVDIGIMDPGKNSSPGQTRSLKERIADSSTVSGTQIVLKNMNFHGGMHKLLPESYPVLEELLDVMKNNPKLVIEIHGHICCQQFDGDGLDTETRINNLSEARAKAIRDYLIANGIDTRRVSYKGFGHSQPIYPFPEQNEEERTANRRVEIKIISK